MALAQDSVEDDISVDDRIIVRNAGRIYFIKSDEIHWIKANGDYINIHTQDKSHLVRETMKAMTEKLSKRKFQRILRSCLVSLNQIIELVRNSSGDYDVILNN